MRSLQELVVNWSRELYTVTESTLYVADSRRECWICGEPFVVGDGMTIANTDRGNKTIHSRCFQAQQ